MPKRDFNGIRVACKTKEEYLATQRIVFMFGGSWAGTERSLLTIGFCSFGNTNIRVRDVCGEFVMTYAEDDFYRKNFAGVPDAITPIALLEKLLDVGPFAGKEVRCLYAEVLNSLHNDLE